MAVGNHAYELGCLAPPHPPAVLCFPQRQPYHTRAATMDSTTGAPLRPSSLCTSPHVALTAPSSSVKWLWWPIAAILLVALFPESEPMPSPVNNHKSQRQKRCVTVPLHTFNNGSPNEHSH